MKADTAQLDSLHTLIDVSRSLTAGLNVDEVVRGILGSAIQVIRGAHSGILLLYREDKRKLVVSHAVGMSSAAYQIAIEPGEGLSGKAFLTGKPSIYPNEQAVRAGMSSLGRDNLRRFEHATGGRRFPQSALSAGLISKGEPIGAFVVENFDEPNAFSSFDLDLVDALAQAAAIAIVNARLFASQKEAAIKLQALNEEIRVQRDQLQRRVHLQESLSEIVKEGGSFRVLAKRLMRLTGASVAIIDALNRVRSCEPDVEAENVIDLDWVAADELAIMLDRAATTRIRQRIVEPRSNCEVLLSPIVGGGEVLGYIGVRAAVQDLDAVDEAAMDSAALVAAAEFLKERAIEESEMRHREDVLDDLLRGRAPPTASSLSMLRPPLGLAAGMLVNQESPAQGPDMKLFRTFISITQEVVERALPPAAIAVRDHHAVVIWPLAARSHDEMESDLATVVGKLQRVAPGWRTTFGIGSKIEDLDDVGDTFNEVRLGLHIRQELGRKDQVFRVESLGAYRFILRAAAGDDVSSFCRSTLGAVIAHDAHRKGHLLSTFRTYLNAGSSVKATAELLSVHPHTVQYRLDRLQTLTRLRLNEPSERLTLEMAVRVADALDVVERSKEDSESLGR